MDTYYLMDEGVLAILAKAEDPRDKRGKVHSMEVLLAIAICAYLSNGNTFERMECFAEEHEAWLCEHVGMESAPCADTFNRLFQALKPESIVQLLQEVSERLRKNAGAVKTIAWMERRSAEVRKGGNPFAF